jgi:hypothetical protein
MADVLHSPKHPEFQDVPRLPRPECGTQIFWKVAFFIITLYFASLIIQSDIRISERLAQAPREFRNYI